MSNRRRSSRKPPAEATAYAAAYKCGHCTGLARVRRKPDQYGVWHVDVHHDNSCPVLDGTVPVTGSGIRAMAAMVKATGSNGLYIPPQ